MFKLKITLFFVFLILFAISFNIFAQNNSQEKYSKVKINITNPLEFKRIEDAGLFLDEGIYKPGLYFETWLSESEIKMLNNSGISYEILIKDWMEYYNNLPKMTSQQIQEQMKQSADVYNVTHSIYGTMGGFLKYSEVVAKLDSMRLQYPNFISAKFSLGTTIEGRTQWCVRVTKNPDAPTGRPEVYLHALIHAREPESMEAQVYFMYWLFENYNIDPLATFILNNREIYWIPVFNPDGYVYNETTNPTGGGQWRCNRHITSGSCGPVDLNRNWGIYQYWNSSNGGSSTDPCNGGSGTYRGTTPFSEPENQNVMNFFISRNFKTGIGAHTYGNYIIKPWAWSDPNTTPDDAIFNQFLNDMHMYNDYTIGTASQTVGYYVRGGTDDWMYNDSGHTAGTHAFIVTCETGTTGFWPTSPEIIPLAQGMLWPCQYIAAVAGPWVNVVSTKFNQSNYPQSGSGNIKVVISNKGIANVSNVKIQCVPQNAYLNFPVQLYTNPSLPSFNSDSTTFNFTIASNAPVNTGLPVLITVKQSDTNIVYSKTMYCLIGNGTLTLADSAENAFSKWTAGGTGPVWSAVTNSYHSPTHSFADNTSNLYQDNQNNYMVLTNAINTSTLPICYLTYWQIYDVENTYDFCYLEASSDNGATWQTVQQWSGTNNTWTQQAFDLTSYANGSAQFKIRFRLQSDVSLHYTGWHVDDIKITNYQVNNGNSLNLKAYLSGFYNGTTMVPKNVTVELHNSTAPYALVESQTVLLNSSGGGNPIYTTAVNGTLYYIVLKTDNGLETWSATPQMFTGSTLTYDFTSAATQAYWSNELLVGTSWCIISGDVNQDGSVDALDRSVCWNDRNLSGTYTTDLNGDGTVDALDRSIAWNNRNLSVQKPALAASPGIKQNIKGDNSKGINDLKLDDLKAIKGRIK